MLLKSENQNNRNYYYDVKALAQQKRAEFNIDSSKLCISEVRKIYKQEKIFIDYREIKSPRIRAAYFCDESDSSVLIKKSLPDEPKLFSLIHELKHHFADRKSILNCELVCGDYNANKQIEIGAEIFAAEFIFPEEEMLTSLVNFGISKENITPEKVVDYKKTCGVKVSYQFIVKRLEYFKIIEKNSYTKIKFKVLEEKLYPPIYKQPWFKKSRKR